MRSHEGPWERGIFWPIGNARDAVRRADSWQVIEEDWVIGAFPRKL